MNVGDYVRTKDYGFIKVKSFYYNEDMIHILDENCNEYDFSKELVEDFKSSPRIIDLVQVGDYVNCYLVTAVSKDIYGETIVFVGQKLIEEAGYYRSYYSKDIKTIVTKEQFESMEYKVVD